MRDTPRLIVYSLAISLNVFMIIGLRADAAARTGTRMGFRISWAAFQGIAKDEVLRRRALVETGARCAGPFNPSNPFSCLEMANGWCVVVADHDFKAVEHLTHLTELSYGCRIVNLQLEEHAMVSVASLEENGKTRWSVSHLSDEGIYDLSCEGDLPPQFESIRSDALRQQDEAGGTEADVDYVIEVPIDLAFSVCGFRHGMLFTEYGDLPYLQLERAKAGSAGKRRGLLELLGFSRRKSR